MFQVQPHSGCVTLRQYQLTQSAELISSCEVAENGRQTP